MGKISISENLVLRAGRQSALPFFVRFPVFSPPVLRPIGDPAPLLGMASPISEGLPKREKCAMLHYIASSAGSAPDRMHRAGDASRDTLEGEDPPLCCQIYGAQSPARRAGGGQILSRGTLQGVSIPSQRTGTANFPKFLSTFRK